jgi:hypothetical protein
MKKSLIALALMATAAAALAQTVTQVPTPQWPQCEKYSLSTQAVCHEASDRLQLRGKPITDVALKDEMQKVSDEDTRQFIRLYEAGGPHGGAIEMKQGRR